MKVGYECHDRAHNVLYISEFVASQRHFFRRVRASKAEACVLCLCDEKYLAFRLQIGLGCLRLQEYKVILADADAAQARIMTTLKANVQLRVDDLLSRSIIDQIADVKRPFADWRTHVPKRELHTLRGEHVPATGMTKPSKGGLRNSRERK